MESFSRMNTLARLASTLSHPPMADTCDDCGKEVASLCDNCGCCKSCCKKYCGDASEDLSEDGEADDY